MALARVRARPEKAVLVGVRLRGERSWSLEASLDELAALADTAGLVVVGRTSQQLDRPTPATLIGPGKVEEVKLLAAETGAGVIVVDHELSPRQQRNLEEKLDRKVLDRTALILDVFAQHARTREGMLQVELAQYEYRLPRLTRMWTHLARQVGGRAGGATGGVGVRGPGETQLEIDRREIRRRIRFLRARIEELRRQRRQYRRRRRRAGMAVVSLVGYTNAGKSTLLNALTQAGVYVADRLFATLDPTTRRVTLPSGRVVLFTDTVGFIQKLPTELVAAFRATLEEIADADVLLHVVDATHPDAVQQAETVEQVLAELGLASRRMVVAANKIDLLETGTGRPAEGTGLGCPEQETGQQTSVGSAGVVGTAGTSAAGRDESAAQTVDEALQPIRDLYPDLVPISALTGQGLEELLAAVDAELRRQMVAVALRIPYREGELLHQVHQHGAVDEERFEETATFVRARVPRYLLGALADYLDGSATDAPAEGTE